MIKELGHGAHSKVYLVRNVRLDVFRAVKVISKSCAEVDRYLREADLVKYLKHPGIPIIFDIEEDNDSISIIEEYISGKSLGMLMINSRGLPISKVCRYGVQICEILEYIHDFSGKSLIHLDLKPDNIMVDDEDNIKLIDYDNASYENEILNQCMGSKWFASPQQYHSLVLDRYADIYSLGMLLLYMAEGSCIQSNVEKIRQKDLLTIIKKCIKHTPLQRYRRADEVKTALIKVIEKNNYKRSTDLSLTIHVAGFDKGSGTTHICMCMTAFLNAYGVRTLCRDMTDTQRIRDILTAKNRNSGDGIISPALELTMDSDGVFQLDGIYLLPDYHRFISSEAEKKYQVILMDVGTVEDLAVLYEENKIMKPDLYIFVSADKYGIDSSKADMSRWEGEKVIVYNHMSGKQFYNLHYYEQNLIRRYRMPCCYDWNVQNEAVYDMFSELLKDAFPIEFGQSKIIGGYEGRRLFHFRKCLHKIFKL